MKWVLGGIILLLARVVLRRLLGLEEQEEARPRTLRSLSPELQSIYEPVALEIETQSAILAISLDEAIEERQAGHPEIAWRLVRLSASEWERLAGVVISLLNTLARHLPVASGAVRVHNVVAQRFKSPMMINHARLQEFLDQVVFRSKLRFQLHLRVRRRAVEALSEEFQRAYREADRGLDLPPQFWNSLDATFHDFDLVAKEALLAFRSFLLCLPQAALAALAADLEPVVRGGVRSTCVPVDR